MRLTLPSDLHEIRIKLRQVGRKSYVVFRRRLPVVFRAPGLRNFDCDLHFAKISLFSDHRKKFLWLKRSKSFLILGWSQKEKECWGAEEEFWKVNTQKLFTETGQNPSKFPSNYFLTLNSILTFLHQISCWLSPILLHWWASFMISQTQNVNHKVVHQSSTTQNFL